MGERDFLASIASMVKQVQGARLGFDDDASDIPLAGGTHMVVKVDTFNSGSDWLPGMTEAQVGRKTAVMVISDLVAKGATPIASMLSLSIPGDRDAAGARDMIRGFSQYCTQCGMSFVGGDMGVSCETVLTGVGLGTAPRNGIVPRGGTRKGDIIAVTGSFGLTSVAFKILLDGLEAPDSLREMALSAAYKPELDLTLVPMLAKEGAITASMDSSDGLGITLNTLASHSHLAFNIERLPVAQGISEFAEVHSIGLLDLIMRGGEEFRIALTLPADKWDRALSVARRAHAQLIPIGRAEDGSGVTWDSPKGPVAIPMKGYDDFREWS
jgi:thiamine-monophosphate kinase